MKKRMIIAVVVAMVAMAAQAQKDITILHTNDTHSAVMPLNKNLNDTATAGRGGFIRRMAMIEEQRSVTPSLLLFDSGDFSQGSSYYTVFRGEVEVGLMNRMGYDVATLGNHEFDFGIDNLARIIRMASFPVVCANYDVSGTALDTLVKPYIVIERDGVRIGVFGLSPNPEGLIKKENYEGVVYRDPIETATQMVATLRDSEQCDVVVCLSHLGYEMPDDVDDHELIAATTGIDVVLGGHSHTFIKDSEFVLNADGHPVLVDQNGNRGLYVGRIVLNLK